MDLFTAIVVAIFASLFLVCLLPSRPFRARKNSVDEMNDDYDDSVFPGSWDAPGETVPLNQTRGVGEVASDSRNYGPVMDLAE